MKIKNYIWTLLLIVLIGGCSEKADEQKALDSKLVETTQLAMDNNDIPALAMVIVRDGKVSHFVGLGSQSRSNPQPINQHSIFQIGSLSKMFTGIIAKRLITEEKLSLDAPIVNYLPESISQQAYKTLSDITVKDLIFHRSGIPGWALNNGRIDGDPMLGGYSELELIKGLDAIKLKFPAGSNLAYSNSGYGILGYICERVSGQTYAALIKQYITDPYGLNNTIAALLTEQQKLMVTPYRKDNRQVATQAWEMGKLTPAGGLFSNMEDLAILMLAQLQAYQSNAEQQANSTLFLTHITQGFYGGNNYGFGIVESTTGNTRDFAHGGDLDGFASHYRFSPKYNTGLILLTSSGGRWFQTLEKELFATLIEQEKHQG